MSKSKQIDHAANNGQLSLNLSVRGDPSTPHAPAVNRPLSARIFSLGEVRAAKPREMLIADLLKSRTPSL